jgi:integrase
LADFDLFWRLWYDSVALLAKNVVPKNLKRSQSSNRRHAANRKSSPYSTDAISAAFARACKILGIEDLRFHDLRREGISRLFEVDRTIPQVAAVSGHRSWTSLKRYTHIRHSADKYQNCKWKPIVLQESRSS